MTMRRLAMGLRLHSTPDEMLEAAHAAQAVDPLPGAMPGVREWPVDLSTFTSQGITRPIFGLLYIQRGSASGGVLELRNAAGGVVTLRPGEAIRDVLRGAELVRAASSVTTGTARLIVLETPDADFRQPNEPGPGDFASKSYTATEAVTTNIPSAATDGIALDGGRGCRAFVEAAAGQTITSGTLVWWYFDPVRQLWAESPTQDTPPTGRRCVVSDDKFTTVGAGRAFVEVRSGSTSAGGGITVTLTAGA